MDDMKDTGYDPRFPSPGLHDDHPLVTAMTTGNPSPQDLAQAGDEHKGIADLLIRAVDPEYDQALQKQEIARQKMRDSKWPVIRTILSAVFPPAAAIRTGAEKDYAAASGDVNRIQSLLEKNGPHLLANEQADKAYDRASAAYPNNPQIVQRLIHGAGVPKDPNEEAATELAKERAKGQASLENELNRYAVLKDLSDRGIIDKNAFLKETGGKTPQQIQQELDLYKAKKQIDVAADAAKTTQDKAAKFTPAITSSPILNEHLKTNQVSSDEHDKRWSDAQSKAIRMNTDRLMTMGQLTPDEGAALNSGNAPAALAQKYQNLTDPAAVQHDTVDAYLHRVGIPGIQGYNNMLAEKAAAGASPQDIADSLQLVAGPAPSPQARRQAAAEIATIVQNAKGNKVAAENGVLDYIKRITAPTKKK